MKKDNYKIEDMLDGVTIGVGQTERYRPATEKIFREKLRFRGGENLRNMDVLIENGLTSKKVRRIIEKRMCQAYHSQLGKRHPRGNYNRHHMSRAVSYQLHNIGQVEDIKGVNREESTHWKKRFDPITGECVFKPKMAYSTVEEALRAAQKEMNRFHNKKEPPTIYKCAHCGKYHIGHIPRERWDATTIVSIDYNLPATA